MDDKIEQADRDYASLLMKYDKDMAISHECLVEAMEEAKKNKKDAERYRFLRDRSTLTWNSLQNKWLMTPEDVDKTIDEHLSDFI